VEITVVAHNATTLVKNKLVMLVRYRHVPQVVEMNIALVDVVLILVLELVIIGAVLTVADQLLEWVGVLIGAMVDVNLGVLEIVVLIAGKAVLGLINKKRTDVSKNYRR
jgi:hypothetical protein